MGRIYFTYLAFKRYGVVAFGNNVVLADIHYTLLKWKLIGLRVPSFLHKLVERKMRNSSGLQHKFMWKHNLVMNIWISYISSSVLHPYIILRMS